MMRSLFSGVSGLVTHQVAMDVEGNNVANVNTPGYKYSRVNFQDSLLQTMKPSTSPQGELGGRNAQQVGSGVSIASIQRVHMQGFTQSTDVKTDMAINGNGFFVVSDDGGKTHKYTRAGNFTFDASGNLVNPNGLIVQGWLADSEFNVDSSMGIKNITIDPAMTVPAQPSSTIKISANLNAGSEVKAEERKHMTSTVNTNDDIGALFSYSGEPIGLKKNNDRLVLDLTRNYMDPATGTIQTDTKTYTFTYGDGTTKTDGKFLTIKDLLDEINERIKDPTGVMDNKVLLTGDGKIAGAQHITRVDADQTTNSVLVDILEPVTYGTFLSRSFKNNVNGFTGADDVRELFDATGKAFMLKSGEGIAVNVERLGENRKFIYREPNEESNTSYLSNNFQDSLDVTKADDKQGFHWTLNGAGEKASMNVGEKIVFSFNNGALGRTITDKTFTYGIAGAGGFQTIEDLIGQVNIALQNANSDKQIKWDADNGKIIDPAGIIGAVILQDKDGNAPVVGTPLERLQIMFNSLGGADGVATSSEQFKKNDVYYFTNTQELVNLYQDALDDAGDPLNFNKTINASVFLKDGMLTIANNGSDNFIVNATGYNAFPKAGEEQIGLTAGNRRFSQAMAMGGTIAPDSSSASQVMYAATFRTGVELVDSSGAKHQVVINFRKVSTSESNNEPTVWKWSVDAPEPTTFEYPTYGEIRFNLDGSIQSYSPPSITINPNTGSASGQIIRLDFGIGSSFGGLTSFAQKSHLREGRTDGYTGGFLEEISADQTGKLIGEFSNGKQFELGQVAIGTFVNDAGLKATGGNLYMEAPNSGDVTIGTAGTANRGDIAPSNLEMSNVDLSKSLTNLIIVQRGYQANSKTITTSDQLLNTLLQLKQ